MNLGRKRLGLGTVLSLAGVVAFVWTLTSLNRGGSLDQQTKVPGVLQTQVEEAGRYYVWDNHQTVFEGEKVTYSPDWPADASIVVRDASGSELPFVKDSDEGWNIGNHSKTSIGYIDVASAEALEIQVDYDGESRILSVSKADIGAELWRRLSGFGIGAILCVLGLLILIWGLFARLRAGRAKSS